MHHLRRSALFIGLVLAVALAAVIAQRPSDPAGASHEGDKSPRLDKKIPPC
jgi:hypothetical protein